MQNGIVHKYLYWGTFREQEMVKWKDCSDFNRNFIVLNTTSQPLQFGSLVISHSFHKHFRNHTTVPIYLLEGVINNWEESFGRRISLFFSNLNLFTILQSGKCLRKCGRPWVTWRLHSLMWEGQLLFLSSPSRIWIFDAMFIIFLLCFMYMKYNSMLDWF